MCLSQNAESLYGFLFLHYCEQLFWWELAVLGRKLVFAAIVNLPKAPVQQAMLAIQCILPYIVMVYRRRPYTTRYLNNMDLLGTAFAASLIFSALVMFGGYETRLDPWEVRAGTYPRYCQELRVNPPICAMQSSVIQIVLILALVAFLAGFVVFDSIPKVSLLFRLRRQSRQLKRLRR